MAGRRTADLPLHSGSAPRWLFDRMVDLSAAITEFVVEEHGREAFLSRLADPHWFQAFGCALGFDWHSSGLTTTTMGALKEGLDPEVHGLAVAGGKGATSRQTPEEIASVADPLRLRSSEVEAFRRTSRLAAAVDNGCVQDEYTLYHHTFVVSEGGDWTVVQQGMDDETARRYHWHSADLDRHVEEPHAAIAAMARREGVLDLTAVGSAETRATALDLVKDDPSHLMRYTRSPGQQGLEAYTGGAADGAPAPADGPSAAAANPAPDLSMPDHHWLQPETDLTRRSIEQLQAAYEHQPDDFAELLEVEGVGPKSLRALALVAELVYGTDSAWADPAKYAYAHGGKDGTPHPVDRDRYDRTVREIRAALEQGSVEAENRRSALRRLAEFGTGDEESA